ncbi:MAG: sensor histidine kinase [Bdellovibrionia bacterium]
MNGVLLQQSRLIAGVPIELSNDQSLRNVTIECVAKEEWRKRLFDIPIVTNFGVGLLIQEWRIFNGIFMGPVFSLLLVLMALFNLRLTKDGANQIMPHLFCGAAGCFYGVYLSGIPDLFFDPSVNTVMQVGLRVLVSAAFINLIGTYSGKRHSAILGLHSICIALVASISLAARSYLTELYELEIIFFSVSTLIATLPLFNVDPKSLEIELMICLGLSWTVAQVLGVTSHYVSNVANLAVWSPSFIATLAAANFYFIYRKAVSRSAEIQLSKQQYYIATQLAHDIRSPLASLNVVISSSNELSNGTRAQVMNAITRIRSIAHELLTKNPSDITLPKNGKKKSLEDSESGRFCYSSEPSTSEFIVPILAALVSEKKLQTARDRTVQILLEEGVDQYEVITNIQRVEFSRIVSNLIDNAVEATQAGERIKIEIKKTQSHVQIAVEDNGKGMQPEVLSQLGRRGFSYGKLKGDSGSGLGVYHAQETIKSWGGELKYESEAGKGTRAIALLPIAQEPAWFCKVITLASPAEIIVLDGDPTAFEYWSKKISFIGTDQVKLMHFVSSRELIAWYRDTMGEVNNPVYLIDYEPHGSDHAGLEVIAMLGVEASAILVTHSWDDQVLIERCQKSSVRILPKGANVIFRTKV